MTELPKSPVTVEQVDEAVRRLDELAVQLSGWSQMGEMAVGRAPERFGRAGKLVADAHELAALARKEWITM